MSRGRGFVPEVGRERTWRASCRLLVVVGGGRPPRDRAPLYTLFFCYLLLLLLRVVLLVVVVLLASDMDMKKKISQQLGDRSPAEVTTSTAHSHVSWGLGGYFFYFLTPNHMTTRL